MSDVIVGIDLGTTNSLIAFCDKKIPRILRDDVNSGIVPSVVHLDEKTQTLVVGQEAKKFRVTDASHTAYSVKRFIGRGKNDLDLKTSHLADTSLSTDQNIIIKLGNRQFSAIELSAEILKKLKNIAEKDLNSDINKAVITVPAYFNDSQRTATKSAGTLAGLDVVRIVNEPTAAALAYGLDKKKNGVIAVYDLGGGTFDISVLKLHDGIFEVLATNGNTSLGGDDFDGLLARILEKQIENHPFLKNELRHLELKALILEQAEKIKKKLTNQNNVVEEIEWKNTKYPLAVSKEEFEKAIQPLVDETTDIVKNTLKDAGLKTQSISEIVMVGGSTRVPLVRHSVKALFGKELNLSMNPEEVVALGAAVQADILAGKNQDMVLLDVVPLSLGIETYGGTFGKLIHRNSKIPSIAKELFTTHIDGQKNVLIHVLQGERELASDCRSLARFDLRGLPPMPAGLPKIEVTFLIDANGILKVRARELTTQTESEVEIKPSYGLTDDQIEKMLSDSFEFAETDLKSRQLIDTRVEAEGVLKAAEKILTEAKVIVGEFVGKSEISLMEKHVSQVRQLAKGEDYLGIRNGLEELENVAKGIAEKVMTHAIRENLLKK